MDAVVISMGTENMVLTDVFNWDGIPGLDGHLAGAYPENDNEPIPSTSLFDFYDGIQILLGGTYRYIRIGTNALCGADAAEFDWVELVP